MQATPPPRGSTGRGTTTDTRVCTEVQELQTHLDSVLRLLRALLLRADDQLIQLLLGLGLQSRLEGERHSGMQ